MFPSLFFSVSISVFYFFASMSVCVFVCVCTYMRECVYEHIKNITPGLSDLRERKRESEREREGESVREKEMRWIVTVSFS